MDMHLFPKSMRLLVQVIPRIEGHISIIKFRTRIFPYLDV
jgi:hypothetical protein